MRFLALVLLLPALALGQGYNRSEWAHWADFDRNCLNTRQEALVIGSLVPVQFAIGNDCLVSSGAWYDPFTGVVFTRAEQVDVDHIVPLAYAHQHGGANWSPLLKKVFANDTENLLIVSLSQNRSKGAAGPAQYLPPNQRFHCEYARLWLHLGRKYELTLAGADVLVITSLLNECRSNANERH